MKLCLVCLDLLREINLHIILFLKYLDGKREFYCSGNFRVPYKEPSLFAHI